MLSKEATWVEQAVDAASSERLLAARRLALPSIEAFGRVLIEDICVPRSRLAEAFRGVEAIARTHRRRRLLVRARRRRQPAPDDLLRPRRWPSPPRRCSEAADAIFALALELGGTVTGEHGIGLLKRDWLAREVGPDVINVHHDLKAALDPHGILNPGKGA